MKLIHTLLFLLRPERNAEDIKLAETNLKSLEKSSSKTLVVYNQGPLSKEELTAFLSQFNLDSIVIGDSVNVGISEGRQRCFQYIWDNYPDTEYISEIHMDMIFTYHWEDAMVEYLKDNMNEPAVSAGIIDKNGMLAFLDEAVHNLPNDCSEYDSFLSGLQKDMIVHGFTHPCIHKSNILKEIGGYNTHFLRGRQCYEDDSLLLGYYYYYGTKADWHPKVNYNTVVYHAVAFQRLDVKDNISVNFNGLVSQYGAMGLKSLSHLHKSEWHKKYFERKYNEIFK